MTSQDRKTGHELTAAYNHFLRLKTDEERALIPENKSHTIKVEHWEEDEYVVTIDGKSFGRTLHKRDADIVADWLKSANELFSFCEKI